MNKQTSKQHKKNLRTGYTTGACAAAAAKAATLAVCEGQLVDKVDIVLPCGKPATFTVTNCELLGEGEARACVVKDAGDDPDVTHGAHITATVKLTDQIDITIEGGEGVARVTKEGLGLAVGSAAINPVPRANITAMVGEVLTAFGKQGAHISISVADGEKIAQGTINERLGLIGGISILGTSGIVRPFSMAAYVDTIETEISFAKATGLTRLVFSTGTRTEKFAMALMPDLAPQAFVQVADFMGAALDLARRIGIETVDIAVMIGKLTKLSAGHLATHVKDVDIDLRFLEETARQTGIDVVKCKKIGEAITGRALFNLLDGAEMERVGRALCILARRSALDHVDGALEVRLVLFDFDGRVVATAAADELPF